MSIHLTPEQENVVNRAIDAGLIHGPEDVLVAGIKVLLAQMDQIEAHNRAIAEAEAWTAELHDWIHSHSRETPLLTDAALDRETIYGDRGI